MKKNLAILCLLLTLAGGYTVYDRRQEAAQGAAPARIGAEAPPVAFDDLSGKTRRLTEFRGKAVVVNFWASWCAPCVAEFPAMVALARQTKDETTFLFLSLDAEKGDIDRFVGKYGQDLPENVVIGRDADARISKAAFGTYRLPETYMLGPTLRLEKKIVGADGDWSGGEMRRTLENIARGGADGAP